MNIAVLWSSPNLNGLTGTAKEKVVAGLRAYGAQVDEIHLNRLHLEHCRACGDGWGICRAKGECVLKDDFADVYRRLVDADGIVFISAVYWHDLTECMKAFLDRLRRCEAGHNGFLQGKRCLLVACAGGTGRGATECLYKLEQALVHMELRAYDRLSVIRYNKDYMLDTLEQAGRLYADRIANGFDMQF